MQSKKTKIIYLVTTYLFALAMFFDGLAGVFRIESGKEALAYLGYPEYNLTILGIAKVLGIIAMIQPVFPIIKEWAYAGFSYIFIGAFMSHFFVGGFGWLLIPPVIMLLLMFTSYSLWKKLESGKSNRF